MTKYLSIILVFLTIGIAQDITNKLGGDTSNDEYRIIDSNNLPLFTVQGDGLVTIESIVNIASSTQGVPNGGTLDPSASYLRVHPTGLQTTFITLSASEAIADGTRLGQILIIENNTISTITIPNNANTRIGSNKILSPDDMLLLIWNGSVWVMPNI